MIKYLVLKNFTIAINMDSGLSTMIDGHVTDLSENMHNALSTRGFFTKIQYEKVNKKTLRIVNPTICITSACNLKCKYCYRGKMDISSNIVPYQTARKFIDLIVSIYPDYEYLRIDLTGYGEPLLAFSEIKKLVTYAETRSTSSKKIDIGFTTNGLLLNNDIINYLEQHKIYFGISIDGLKRQNDAYRKGEGIRSVFDLVDNNISKLDKKMIGVSSTLTNKSKKLVRMYNYYQEKFNVVTMKPVRLNSGFYDLKTSNQLIKEYGKLSKKLLIHAINEDFNYILPILRDEDFFGKFLKRVIANVPVIARCGAATTKIAIDIDQNLYICGAAIGNKDFIIGDLLSGIDEKKSDDIVSEIIDRKLCTDCWAKYVCGGPCLVQLHNISQDRDTLDENFCYLIKETIKIAYEFKYDLIKNNSESFKFLYSKCLDMYYI